MSIQRYDINEPTLIGEGYSETTPNNDGQIVYYDDHAAEVERLTTENKSLTFERDKFREQSWKTGCEWQDMKAERDAAVALNKKMRDALNKISELHDFDCHMRHEIVREALSTDSDNKGD